MQLISSVSLLLIKLQLTLIFPLRTKVIFKFTLGLKLWLVYTIFSAIILSHVLTHSLKSYYPIFLHAFILILLITLPTNTPRMKNQFTQLTHLFLHFVLTTQLTSLKYFYIVPNFYATPKLLPQGRQHATYKRAAGREQPTTRKKGPRP